MRGTAGFPGRGEQCVLGEALVELTEVVEGDPCLRQRGQCRLGLGIAHIPKQPEAHAFAGDFTQLLLDGLDRTCKVSGGCQAHREQAGEPADGAGQVDVVEQFFAAMAFQLNQCRAVAGPAAEGSGQCGQQQVVDLGAVDRWRLLQQLAGLFTVQANADALAQMPGLAGLRVGGRQRVACIRQLPLPPAQFTGGNVGLCIRLKFVRPGLERARLGWQVLALVSRLQIFKQYPPRNAVHRQMVNHQQQALRAIRLGNQGHT